MTATTTALEGTGTFARGIHPPEGKHLAEDARIAVMPTPKQVAIALLQHIGAPCEMVVKNRQEVALGEMVGKAGGFISSPIHATVAGKVGKVSSATLPNGRHVKTVIIKASDEGQLEGQELFNDVLGGPWPTEGLEQYDPKQISEAVCDAGIVGQGGAAFPTHVKLIAKAKTPIDTILINGCECEPYLTADHRLMLEAPGAIVTGALLARRANGAGRIIVAIEDNKGDAIAAMRKVCEPVGIEVASLHTKYPMGGERQTVLAVTRRAVPTGGLPLAVGVVVMNVATAAAVARAVTRGKPLTHRVVTVTGAGVAEHKNLLVPIGISYGELIDYCGGLRADAARVIAGGPMMGFTLGDLSTPVTKATSGITVLTGQDVARAEATNCVRCGRCVDVCPLNLVPTKIALAARHEDWDLARRYYITACMECGCCAYTCPAGLPLVQLMRVGKAKMPRD